MTAWATDMTTTISWWERQRHQQKDKTSNNKKHKSCGTTSSHEGKLDRRPTAYMALHKSQRSRTPIHIYIYTSTCTYDINTWHIHMTYTYIYIWVDPGHASAWAHFLLRCQHHPAARGACKPSSSWARTLSSPLVRMMRVLVTTITMRTMMLILGRIIFLPGMYTVGSTNLVHMHAWWASSSFVHIHVA